MTNTLIHGIIDALSGSVSKEVIVFLISMIPILELRGALLVAGPILGVKVSTAIPLCIIGNIIPVPFILLLITPVFNCVIRGNPSSGNRRMDRVSDCSTSGNEI